MVYCLFYSDIPNTGLVSNVSPYVKVYYTNRTQAEPIKFATTDVVKKDPTPEFTTVVSFVWNKGMGQVTDILSYGIIMGLRSTGSTTRFHCYVYSAWHKHTFYRKKSHGLKC